MTDLSWSANRRAAWRSRERTRYWCGVTPSTVENSRRKWNGLIPACAAAASRSIGRGECASIQSAVSTAAAIPPGGRGRLRASPADHLDKAAGEQLPDLVETDVAAAIGCGLGQFAQHHQFRQRRGAADLPDIALVADRLHQFRLQKERQALIAADVVVAADIFAAGMADQDRSGHQLEQAAAAAAAEAALAHKEIEWQWCRSTNGVSPGPALQRKSDTEIDWRCSRGVTFMPRF